jgi:hypothetical protein
MRINRAVLAMLVTHRGKLHVGANAACHIAQHLPLEAARSRRVGHGDNSAVGGAVSAALLR